MNLDPVESQLARTLTGRAAAVVDGPSFTPDSVVATGRATRLRRRRAAIAGVVAVVSLLAVGAGALAVSRPYRGQAPVGQLPTPPAVTTPSATGRPSPSVSASPSAIGSTLLPAGTVPVGSVGLSVLSGNDILPAGGGRFTLALPAGYQASAAIRVPDGWVVEATHPTAVGAVFFVPNGGAPTRVGDGLGNVAVSPDGRTLITEVRDPQGVTVVALPSLTEGKSAIFTHGAGPIVRGVSGDWALVMDATGDGGPTTAYAWNFRTGVIAESEAEVSLWGMSDDGKVLRRMFPGSAAPPTSGCADVVPIAEMRRVRPTGLCSQELARVWMPGQVSPSGSWVVASPAEKSLVLLRTADLRAGRWQPVSSALPAGSVQLFWDTANTFVARDPGGQLYRCQPGQTCATLAVPGGLTDPTLVRNRGVGAG